MELLLKYQVLTVYLKFIKYKCLKQDFCVMTIAGLGIAYLEPGYIYIGKILFLSSLSEV
jgi:hypothetical protein